MANHVFSLHKVARKCYGPLCCNEVELPRTTTTTTTTTPFISIPTTTTTATATTPATRRSTRVVSLDVFRGLFVFLMMFVDYGGGISPSIIAHAPWNGLHLADFVMPFFLFIVGVALALVYKKLSNRLEASWKAFLRFMKLFLFGILLQGGYFHGINSLTYGVDIEKIRWLGILQRIAIGYFIAALCEIWLTRRTEREFGLVKSYYGHWLAAFALCTIYLGLLYGLYVPDWQFEVSDSTLLPKNETYVYTVTCNVRGNLGPGCNSAGMIDRYVLGLDHLYAKPAYKNLKECKSSEIVPSWCYAPFDPEGLLSSVSAAVTSIIGLQYGHVLAHVQDHKERLKNWSIFSVVFLLLGSFLALVGIPVNKALYTISYMLITSGTAGLTFCALYLLVDVNGYERSTFVLKWMGVHSLAIFIIVSSNIAIILLQGFYLKAPQNNLVHWVVSFFVQR